MDPEHPRAHPKGPCGLRYCGWVFPLTASDISSYGFNQVICLDASPPGAGCTDCTLLAAPRWGPHLAHACEDCVQKCNRCAGCQAVQWMPLNPSGCIFMADVTAPSPPPFLDYVSSEQLATLGSFTAGVYVNSRPLGNGLLVGPKAFCGD